MMDIWHEKYQYGLMETCIFMLNFFFFLVSIELIRKRSEHNEGEIGTLEEISLHQEDITKIENLQNWCKDLKILLLQSNLILKIGNCIVLIIIV